jgi:hypothetical protein
MTFRLRFEVLPSFGFAMASADMCWARPSWPRTDRDRRTRVGAGPRPGCVSRCHIRSSSNFDAPPVHRELPVESAHSSSSFSSGSMAPSYLYLCTRLPRPSAWGGGSPSFPHQRRPGFEEGQVRNESGGTKWEASPNGGGREPSPIIQEVDSYTA